ncbi:hypothetical protein VE02_00875 [Pseudogymnoascus sp. 03VT05]|nr:hypothetical protein VE02_00875 [Pseudogymnoascus sp. 03VT05]
MEAIYSHSNSYRASHRRRREKSGHPLVRDYKDDVANCRDSVESSAVAALADAHAKLVNKVGEIKTTNTTLLSTLQTQSEALLAPLEETEASMGVVDIGQQIETFRAQLAAAEKELERLWTLWNEAQGEIEKLTEEGGDEIDKKLREDQAKLVAMMFGGE